MNPREQGLQARVATSNQDSFQSIDFVTYYIKVTLIEVLY